MPHAQSGDGVRLYYEATGSGSPRSYSCMNSPAVTGAGNRRSRPLRDAIDASVSRPAATRRRMFPQKFRPIRRPARPMTSSRSWTQRRSTWRTLWDSRWGGFAVLHAALRQPQRVRSLVVAGTGYGAEKEHEDYFRDISEQVARGFESGPAEFAPLYAEGASRVQFQAKDPRGWRQFAQATGPALGDWGRPTRYAASRPDDPRCTTSKTTSAAWAPRRWWSAATRTTIACNREYSSSGTIPACGLAVLPKCGHTINLEEPELFNRLLADFLAAVESGHWTDRDPRADPGQIMRTS